MKNFGKLALLGVALAVTASSASATEIKFTTTGDFISDSSNVITFGSGANTTTITFTGSTEDVLSPSGVSLGQVAFTSTGTGAGGSAAFDLTINQTLPSVGSGTLTATLAGTIFVSTTPGQTNGTLDFTQTSIIIGTGGGAVTYNLQQPNGGYALVTPDNTPAYTTIQAGVVAAPEPNSLMLLGTGLLGAAGMLFRRRLTA
jgi:hypothetical protein